MSTNQRTFAERKKQVDKMNLNHWFLDLDAWCLDISVRGLRTLEKIWNNVQLGPLDYREFKETIEEIKIKGFLCLNLDDFSNSHLSGGKKAYKELAEISEKTGLAWNEDLANKETFEEKLTKMDEYFSEHFPSAKEDFFRKQEEQRQLPYIENVKEMLSATAARGSITISFPQNAEDVSELKALQEQGYKVELKITKPETK